MSEATVELPAPIYIGDLVFVISCDVGIANGKIGTVRHFAYDTVGVEMPFSHKKMTNLGGLCEPGYGVWLKTRYIKKAVLVSKVIKTHGSFPIDKIASEPVPL